MNSPSSWRTTHWSTLWSCLTTTTPSSTPTCCAASSEERWRWWARHPDASIPCFLCARLREVLWNACGSGSDGGGRQIRSGHAERGQRDRNPYEVHQEDRRKPPSWRRVMHRPRWSGLQRTRSHNEHCHTQTERKSELTPSRWVAKEKEAYFVTLHSSLLAFSSFIFFWKSLLHNMPHYPEHPTSG